MNKREKRLGIAEQFKIGVWNVRGLAHKEMELQRELNLMDVDIAIIPETKKKLKDLTELAHYIVTVSYTHLDVYKRQILHCAWCDRKLEMITRNVTYIL